MWSDCLLDLGMDFLVGNTVRIRHNHHCIMTLGKRFNKMRICLIRSAHLGSVIFTTIQHGDRLTHSGHAIGPASQDQAQHPHIMTMGEKTKKTLRMFYKWSTTSGSDTTTTTQPGHGKDPTYLGYAMMLGLSTTLNKLHDKRNNEYIEDMLPKFPSDVRTRHYNC